ncbi:TraM recognition domain-containing protein [Nocardioides convexus]|uniref:TraM recognition domain-containing protein n=1 Tax=Nocardioides convexus TaxID=2712224 RepID=UPI0024183BAF|nr:TraM recognition domain-containing protein [Nocardioides convexus]
MVMFGGSKDVAFNQEISDLLGQVRIGRRTHRGSGGGYEGDDIAIMRPEEVRQLPERQALVIAENGKPIIAKPAPLRRGQGRRTAPGRPAGAARAADQRPAPGHHPRGPRHRRARRGPPTRLRRRRERPP